MVNFNHICVQCYVALANGVEQITTMEEKVMKNILINRLVCAANDFFKCSGCGRVVRVRTPGNSYTCSECGSKMYRM